MFWCSWNGTISHVVILHLLYGDLVIAQQQDTKYIFSWVGDYAIFVKPSIVDGGKGEMEWQIIVQTCTSCRRSVHFLPPDSVQREMQKSLALPVAACFEFSKQLSDTIINSNIFLMALISSKY